MSTARAILGFFLLSGAAGIGRAPAPAAEGETKPAAKPPASGAAVRPAERWKQFREHLEKAGRKDLLPEDTAKSAAVPTGDAIQGILFRMSPDLAAAHDLLDAEPPDVAGARARLKRLEGTGDPYVADYAALFGARCDLAEKRYREAARNFEKVLASSRNLASAAAHRGLAECYRGLNEVTLEVLELRFLLTDLPADRAADRDWAETRLAEIRRDHPGPLADSAKRMRDASTRLATAGAGENGETAGEVKKIEEILEKVAKLLEEEARMRQAQAAQAQASGSQRGQRNGAQRGDGKADRKDAAADRSKLSKEKAGDTKLKDPARKDEDAWGSINEREVAKALQDLWGKIPPEYRKVVADYFKDVSGLAQEDREKR